MTETSLVWPNWYYGRNDYGRNGTMDETSCNGQKSVSLDVSVAIATSKVSMTFNINVYGIGSVCPNYTFAPIIKKYFNEHDAYLI